MNKQRTRITRQAGVTGIGAALALSLVATLPTAEATAASAAGVLPAAPVNASFEEGLIGWTTTATVGAPAIEGAGIDGGSRLTHWLPTDGRILTTQQVQPGTGWFTLRASVKSGGGGAASSLVFTGCGTDGNVTIPSTETDDAWLSLAVSGYSDGTRACNVGLVTDGEAGAWASIDALALAPGTVDRQIRGADLSGVTKNEDLGGQYFAQDGSAGDPVQILADEGANFGRVKVWVDPADGYNSTAQVVSMSKRIKAAGMQLLVDFHYSDRWTDPGAQGTPAAWVGHSPEQLAADVAQHTTTVLTALKDAGITADYVQVGNEINPGMLWPSGQTWDVDPNDGVADAQWDNLALFLTAGSNAVKAIDPSTKVILHLTNINNGIDGLTWWFDNVTSRGVPFDLIGLSYYSYWHGSLADLQNAVSTLSTRYDRDVLVVETAYPFTLADNANAPWENVIDTESELTPGYPATVEGQRANFRAVQDVVAAAPGGRGLGAVYWEPAWTSVPGNGWDPADPSSGNAWENQAVFDFDGVALPSITAFAADDRSVPAAPHPDPDSSPVVGPASSGPDAAGLAAPRLAATGASDSTTLLAIGALALGAGALVASCVAWRSRRRA